MFSLNLAPPAIEYAHNYYGDTKMTADNIYFVNSVEDPWQYAGMRFLSDPNGT